MCLSEIDHSIDSRVTGKLMSVDLELYLFDGGLRIKCPTRWAVLWRMLQSLGLLDIPPLNQRRAGEEGQGPVSTSSQSPFKLSFTGCESGKWSGNLTVVSNKPHRNWQNPEIFVNVFYRRKWASLLQLWSSVDLSDNVLFQKQNQERKQTCETSIFPL